MSTRKIAWAMLSALVSFATLHCNRKSPTVEPAMDPDAGAAANAAPTFQPPAPYVDPNPIREIDAGPPDWYKCQVPQDCVVVSAGRCCAPCDPIEFKGYSAVNSKHKDDFMAFQGCANTPCPCPTRMKHVPNADANFLALCQAHRCVAVDLRYSKYSQCKTSGDCTLRHGAGCCEGCGDEDLVTYNPKSSLLADTCPVKKKCPPTPEECKAHRMPNAYGECAGGYCQLADY